MEPQVLNSNPRAAVLAGAEAEQRRFITRVYAWMTGGLALTGLVALWVAATPAVVMAIASNRMLFYGLMIAELGAVLAFGPIARRASSAVVASVFLVYAGLNGLTFSVLLLLFTSSSVAGTFFITAATFGSVSVYGMVTRRDLTSVGSFMMMGLIGIIIASLVNLFLKSEMVSWVTSFIGVIVFTGLAAYDTQKLKAMNVPGREGTDEGNKTAISGALVLYLDFINLFLSLLRLTGRRR